MIDQDKLDVLLDRWEEARERGEELAVVDLCRECPELENEVAARIRALEATDWMMADDDEQDLEFPPLPPAESLSAHAVVPASVTLDQFTANISISGVMSADEVSRFEASDAQDLAAHLLRGKRLTKYQAKRIAEGKTGGLVLGNYVILDKIGAGGMGQVFKARHRRMDRVVALKVLPKEAVDSPMAVDRFHQEVRAAAKLEHPNIVTAHDADESDGTHLLVMQYVDGQDLASLVRKRGPMSIANAVDCVIQAANGLKYAHSVGVVHRDIKPANLLLGSDGTVKILDMGLARLEKTNGGNGNAVTEAQLTQDGAVMGTVDFMSPEQAMDTHNADARSDIYSLGCTLFYLLTGKPVYGGATLMAKMMAHKEADIPVLDERRDGVPAELSAVFERMLAKEPDDRYQTVAALLADLEDVADGLEEDESGMDTAPPQETALEVQSTETSSASFDQTIDFQAAAGNAGIREGEAPAEPDVGSDADWEGEAPAEPSFPVVSARQEPRPPGLETASSLRPEEEETFGTRSKKKADWRILAGGGVALLALAIFGWLYFAGIIFKVELPEGTIRIETNVPDVEVFVDNEQAVRLTYSEDRKTIEVKVKPGAKMLTVSKDGFKAEVTKFSLKTQKGPIEVTFDPTKPDPVRPDKERMATVDGDMDREVAEWALSVGGSVMGNTGSGQGVSASKVDDLPKEAFSVHTIWLRRAKQVPEEQYVKQFTKLQHLKGLITLYLSGHQSQNVSDRVLETIASHWSIPVRPGDWGRLFLVETSITDAGLKHLSEFPNLGEVDLTGLEITDAGLKHLGTLPDLVRLDLGSTKITDAGIEHLVHLPLTQLSLSRCPEITDSALQYASQWTNLESLGLVDTQVTDAGLVHLEGLKKLEGLDLAGTKVSTAGVERLLGKLPVVEWISVGDPTVGVDHDGLAMLQKAHPHCRIGVAPISHGGMKPAFWVLWLNGTLQAVVEDGEPIEIVDVEAVPKGKVGYRIISVNFNDNPSLNDACAERFASIQGLQRLSLRNTDLTDAAVEDLKSLTALEELDLTGTKITAQGIETIKAALPDCKVVWEGEESDQGE